jgi:hypothetical protein
MQSPRPSKEREAKTQVRSYYPQQIFFEDLKQFSAMKARV